MSRLLWVGVGAAGGIYVYRKGQRAWDRTKDRGVAGNATLVAATAAQWYTQLLSAPGQQPGAAGIPAASAAAGSSVRPSSARSG